MRVSIITACYNRAGTIAHALRSVSGQTYPHLEHIVVDGGSTDGTLAAVAAHRPPVARLIPGPDRGIYDALNKGVAASTGDIVGFLHSDDFYAGDDIIAAVAAEMERGGLEALYGDVAYVRPGDVERVVRVFSSRRFRPSRIAWGWVPAHPALFVSRSLFERFGEFKTDYQIAGDFEFIARIFAQPRFRYAYLPRVLVNMRMGGISTRGWRSTVLGNREILRACRENGIRTNYLKILSKYPAKLLEFLP